MVCPVGSHACAWRKLKHFIPWKRVRKRRSSSGVKPVLLYSIQKNKTKVLRSNKEKSLPGTTCILEVADGWEQLGFPRTSGILLGKMTYLSQIIAYLMVFFCAHNSNVLYPLDISWLSQEFGKGSLFLACTTLTSIELWSFITEPEKYLTGRKNTTRRLSTFSLPHFHELLLVLSSFIMLNDFSSPFKYLEVSMLLLRQTGFCFCNVFLLQSSSSLSVAVLWVASSLPWFFW